MKNTTKKGLILTIVIGLILPLMISAAEEYLGNMVTMKFHDSGCRYFDCKDCTMVFQSRDAAVDAGYDPCGVCNP